MKEQNNVLQLGAEQVDTENHYQDVLDLSDSVHGKTGSEGSNDEQSDTEADTVIDNEEENNISYPCSKCGKQFSRKYFAKLHCKEKPPKKCETCGVTISTKNMKRHKVACAKKAKTVNKQAPVFTCSVCGKQFSKNAFNLRRHMQKIHGEIFVGQLKCPILDCEFSTNIQHQMNRHTTISHGSKKKKCTICGYKLSTESGLRKHMLAIHGFGCEKCGQQYPSEDMLKAHQESNHKEQMPSSDRTGQVIVSRNIGEHSTFNINTTENKE